MSADADEFVGQTHLASAIPHIQPVPVQEIIAQICGGEPVDKLEKDEVRIGWKDRNALDRRQIAAELPRGMDAMHTRLLVFLLPLEYQFEIVLRQGTNVPNWKMPANQSNALGAA